MNIKGDLEVIESEYNLAQAIVLRLKTMQGELSDLGHSSYGSRLHELIGEPNNERTRELVVVYTRECLEQDPRVKEILSINVTPVRSDPNRVDISISIIAIELNTVLNLVFPFFLEVA
jgi:phage baseplate assembly protein W